MNDHDYVNFSQEHELNYILKKFDKRQTQSNRNILVGIGESVKASTGKSILKHGEFHPYVKSKLSRLE